MKLVHYVAGIEIFFLAGLPAWLQSPTGKSFIHSHDAIADLMAAAYVGFRAVKLAQNVSQDNTQPPAPGEQK